jgi:hypothetical protein
LRPPFQEGRRAGSLLQCLSSWILDVDGQRLVVDASYGADAITEQRDQLAAMVESLEFVAPAA